MAAWGSYSPLKVSPSAGSSARAGAAGTAERGTPRWTRGLLQHFGADRRRQAAPRVGPAVGLVEADQHSSWGSSMGATATNEAMRAVGSSLSSFWLVPLLPPTR